MSTVTVVANLAQPLAPPIESVTITVSPELAKVLCYLVGNTSGLGVFGAGADTLWLALRETLDYTPPELDAASCPLGYIHFPG